MSARVFVAGASGAIGRPLVDELLAAGHEVTGMTRREGVAEEIRAAGARAAVCDVFDRGALGKALAAARPEVVVHELTALPRRLDPRRRDTYPATNRIRREGTRNLIEAARPAGARRILAQSIAFVYAPLGPRVVDERAPVTEGVAGHIGEAFYATYDLERQVLGADGIDGLVLRYGFFYGPGTSYAPPDGFQASQVRRRRLPIVGAGEAMTSFVHVDDAASATAAAVERGEPGIYNVCDDEPAAARDWLPAYAAAIGAKPPRRVPVWLVRLIGGRFAASFASGSRGASNAKARRELGWEPRWPSWRQGFAEGLG